MSPNALKRARHVITENLRTVAAADALIRHDLQELGRLMAEAHVSYSRDFEASCVEADAMVALAQELPGLIGARLTGGGFGGCTINLVEREKAAELLRRTWRRAMRQKRVSCPRFTFATLRAERTPGWDGIRLPDGADGCLSKRTFADLLRCW